ncbi:hypothetical protein ABPG72_020555 [Tetrahymena utriculariae]
MLMYILGALTVYWATSYFFLKNPQILKKKKSWKSQLLSKALNKEQVLHIAHRGGSRYRVENTIESFENGLKEGTNVLELDVCMTKDKQIIVIHDDNLKRMCGVGKLTEEFDYKDLPKFQEVIHLDFSVGGKVYSKDYKNPYIPTLEEVFTRFPGIHMNIEIKTPNEEFIQMMNKLIIKHKREEITIWGCKNPKMSQRLKEVNPNINRFFSLGGLKDLIIKYFTGLLPFSEIQEESLQIPIFNREHYEWKKLESKGFAQHLACRVYFFAIRLLLSSFVAQPLFEHLRQRGILVIFWVMNDLEMFEKCLQFSGCVGIMTDEPALLAQFLKEKSVYKKD